MIEKKLCLANLYWVKHCGGGWTPPDPAPHLSHPSSSFYGLRPPSLYKFAHHRLVQKAVLKNKTLLVLRSLNSFNYIIVKTLQVRKCIVIMLYIKYLSSYLKNNIYYGGLWRKNHGNRDTLLLILSGIPVSFVFGWALLW